MKPTAAIFDVDGTLCDVRTARHHVMKHPKDFDAFHEAAAACPPHRHVVAAARRHQAAGDAILVVTARKRRWERATSMWLALNNIPSDALYMRGDRDQRKDVEVKRDILARIRRRFDVVHAYDDNPNVIGLWRAERIPVTVVPGWDEAAG